MGSPAATGSSEARAAEESPSQSSEGLEPSASDSEGALARSKRGAAGAGRCQIPSCQTQLRTTYSLVSAR